VPLPRPAPEALVVAPTLDLIVFTQKAAFISDLVTVTDWLKLFGAARYADQRNSRQEVAGGPRVTTYQDATISPNFGILIQPNDRLTLYGNYSTGITTGVQIPQTAANFANPSIFLDPARTRQIEFGVKAELFAGAIATLAWFDISQPLATLGEDNIFGYIGDQNHRGLEVSLAGQITPALRLVAGGLYLDPSIRNPANPAVDGNRPSGVARFQFNLYADYELPGIDGLALNAGIFYTGDRFANDINTFKVDGYLRVDAGLRYGFDLGAQRLTARLNLRNLFNADFIEGTQFGSFNFGAPRAAIFSLTTEF
jgi:iron complex outermembrane receptor protein